MWTTSAWVAWCVCVCWEASVWCRNPSCDDLNTFCALILVQVFIRVLPLDFRGAELGR